MSKDNVVNLDRMRDDWRERQRRIQETARNAQRLAVFRKRQAELKADRLYQAREILRQRMPGFGLGELMQAFERARRAVNVNGTVGAAVHFGLPKELQGQDNKA